MGTEHKRDASRTVTIANGANASSVIDCSGEHTLSGFVLPSTWDNAIVSLLGSLDNSTFVQLKDSDGVWQVPTAAGAAGICPPPDVVRGWPYLKIQSGVVGAVTAQANGPLTIGYSKVLME